MRKTRFAKNFFACAAALAVPFAAASSAEAAINQATLVGSELTNASTDANAKGKTLLIQVGDTITSYCAAVHQAASVNKTFNASGNKVNMTGGTVGGSVFAVDLAKGNADGNGITASGTDANPVKIGDTAMAAFTHNGTVTNNSVTLTKVIFDPNGGANTNCTVSGGLTLSGDAGGKGKGNTVTLTDVKAAVSVSISGGYANHGMASGNTVNIYGKSPLTSAEIVGGGAYDGDALNNKVNFSGSDVVVGRVSGGQAQNGSANGNEVNIIGSTVISSVAGGSGDREANSNTVTIKGDADLANSDIAGGLAYAKATGNSVDLDLADETKTVKNVAVGNVFLSPGSGAAPSSIASDAASGNNFYWNSGNISGTLAGGAVTTSVGNGGFRVERYMPGNTITIRAGKTTKTAGEIGGFDTYKFILNENVKMQNGYSQPVLQVLTSPLDLTGITVPAAAGIQIVGSFIADKDDTVVLIKNVNGTYSGNDKAVVKVGTTMEYDMTIEKGESAKGGAADSLVARINSADSFGRVQEETKSYMEGRAAGIAAINMGVDLAAGAGIENAVQEAKAAKSESGGAGVMAGFSAFSYGKDRVETGSYVDSHSFGGIIGISAARDNSAGSLTYGGFIEGGKGSYTSHNDFSSGAFTAGGDTSYGGLGVLVKQECTSGTYYEAMLHGGRLKQDYDGVFGGLKSHYDAKSTYWGGHIGIGHIFKLSDENIFDVYGKGIYTHMSGDSVDLGYGGRMDMGSTKSRRLRLGTRFTHSPKGKTLGYYAGAAFDYEFGGKAVGSINGLGLDSPSVKGGTGIVELGLTLKSGAKDNVSLDLGMEGHCGKRRGVSGVVKFALSF